MDMDEIIMHLAAGQFFGERNTCGNKIKHDSEEKAKGHADALNRRGLQAHEVEPYPCYWCGYLNNNEFTWHVGRKMNQEERQMFLKLGTYYIISEEER